MFQSKVQERSKTASSSSSVRRSDQPSIAPCSLWHKLAAHSAPKVGSSTDPQEREAEQVAQRVVGRSSTRPVSPSAGEVRPGIVTGRAGEQLQPQLLASMNDAFGSNFEQVRIHRNRDSAQLNESLDAEAVTHGNDIHFNTGAYRPDTPGGQQLVAHELTHVLQQTGSPGGTAASNSAAGPIQYRGAGVLQRQLAAGPEHGQHVSGGRGDLTADLTSPVAVGREVRVEANFGYIPGYTGPSGPPAINGYPYRWTVVDRTSGDRLVRSNSTDRFGTVVYPRAGQFRITCEKLTSAGSAAASVSMDQDAAAPDSWLASHQSSSNIHADNLAELVHDFRQYVLDSAASTGPHGVTARFISAILSMEMDNTDPWSLTNAAAKSARGSEIQGVEDTILERQRGESVDVEDDIDRSVGVGQMRLSTLAQLEGVITWREQDRTNRSAARAATQSDFAGLRTTSQERLLLRLRWPKSNIQAVAELLARLKSRSNRYPAMDRASFGSNQRACEIIATEYNLGPSTTAEADASPNFYGPEVWQRMSDSVLAHYFPNT